MLTIKFQYFPANIETVKPLGEISLEQFIEAIRNPKDHIKDIFKQIAECEREGDWKKKAGLKQNNLYYFIPSVLLNGRGRSYKDIVDFLPLMVIEFDHVKGNIVSFRDKIFDNVKSVVCGFVSASGAGAKFLIKIPKVNSIEEYKEYYYGICEMFENTPTFDSSNVNCVLPLFLSWDETIRYRDNPETWAKRGYRLSEVNGYKGEVPEIEDLTDEDKKEVLRVCYANILKADEEQVGHPNVKKCGLMLGNFTAAGYIGEDESKNYALNWVENSEYLKLKQETYSRTILSGIEIGLRTPLYLLKHEKYVPEELKEIQGEKVVEVKKKYYLYTNLNEYKIIRTGKTAEVELG